MVLLYRQHQEGEKTKDVLISHKILRDHLLYVANSK